jgi:hypothetical protein
MRFRGLLMAFLVGGMLGGFLVSWFGADLIHWYAQPPFPMGCDCGQAMKWAMEKQVMVGAMGWVLGGVGFSVLYGLFSRPKKQPVAS